MINASAQQTQLEQMEDSLNDLAMTWRSCTDPKEEHAIVEQYQSILRQMIAMGFRDSLDMDAELPDRFLPQEYFDLHEQKA